MTYYNVIYWGGKIDMIIEKKKNDYNYYDISLNEGDKTLSFLFCGNGDLYWNINNKNYKDDYKQDTFYITKENYDIYMLFNRLYDDIKNINIYNLNDIPFYCNSQEEYLDEINNEKRMCKESNVSNYNELYNEEDKTITWYSDEVAHEVANYVTIKKEEDAFIISFNTQPDKEGYDNEYNMWGLSIRFRNSGSSYHPFNILFMKMYNELQNIDELYYQSHIEEYLYNKKLTLKNNIKQ